jgi:hypothetical protein
MFYKDNHHEERQTHTHEYLRSTQFAEQGDDRHNHRFAGVTGEAICYRDSHVHRLFTRTDFLENHFHFIEDVTGPAIEVDHDKHVHFICGRTSENDGHRHRYAFATLIEDPASKDRDHYSEN